MERGKEGVQASQVNKESEWGVGVQSRTTVKLIKSYIASHIHSTADLITKEFI
jgi:hypothetical protein